MASRPSITPSYYKPVIETEVHQRLRAYLREQGHTQWPHHLTMARLVARALRVGRSALLQIDSLAAYQGSHRLSYLIPALLWPEPAILALPEPLLDSVLQQDIPSLQQGLPVIKPVQSGDRWPHENFQGLLVTSAQGWLADRLGDQSHYPTGIPTLIDGAGDLEQWAQRELSVQLSAQDWEALMLAYPSGREFIREVRSRLTHAIFQHPANPYRCHLIEAPERALMESLYEWLALYAEPSQLPLRWQQFWHQFFQPEQLAWSSRQELTLSSVTLHCGPTEVNAHLAPIWTQQPVVLMGAALDASARAERYRDRLGLEELTCLKFGPDRHQDLVQLYLPDHLPMPNTSEFQSAVLKEIRTLLSANSNPSTPTVIVIGDQPLKERFAAILAAEFGSRVQLEAPVSAQGILITGWEYWRSHQATFATPGLFIITTLPIPSLENPLVAGRVAAYKHRRQDWFKAYLLPEALSTLQQAIAPVRWRNAPTGNISVNSTSANSTSAKGHRPQAVPTQGVIALLDNRVNHRSYGAHVLSALSPMARSSYLNEDWFCDATSAIGTGNLPDED
jgi:ATP-dependent DNA helicase DinG